MRLNAYHNPTMTLLHTLSHDPQAKERDIRIQSLKAVATTVSALAQEVLELLILKPAQIGVKVVIAAVHVLTFSK